MTDDLYTAKIFSTIPLPISTAKYHKPLFETCLKWRRKLKWRDQLQNLLPGRHVHSGQTSPCLIPYAGRATARAVSRRPVNGTGHLSVPGLFMEDFWWKICCYMHCLLFYVFLCCSMYCSFCVALCIVCVYMCTELLPPAGHPIAI